MTNVLTQAEFDHTTRGKNYRLANDTVPGARKNEVNLMLKKISAKRGEIIVDFGCGNGILTYPLSMQVGTKGKIYAVDNSKSSLEKLVKNSPTPNIKIKILNSEEIPLENKSVDAVVTLASFHHVPNKEKTFMEFSRILRHGGRLVMADVSDHTDVQKYFDGPVDKFCSTGHKHKFLDKKWAEKLCKKVGLRLKEFKVEQVHWQFDSEFQAKKFLHTIHDAICTPEECLKDAKKYLGFFEKGGKFNLNWQLFYLIAQKA